METKQKQMEPEAEEMAAEEIVIPKRKRSYWEFGLAITIVVVLISVVGVLGFLLIKTLSGQNEEKASIQTIAKEIRQETKVENKAETNDPIKKEEAPVAKEANPLDVAIKILNGGAVGGSAGKVKEILVAKGYKKMELGNSDQGGYAGVTVFYQAEMKTVAEKVAADLKAKYPTVQTKAGTSTEEKSGPVVIILGK